MRGAKPSFSSVPTKLTLLAFLFIALIFLILKSTSPLSTTKNSQTTTCTELQKCPSTCNKLPPSLSEALIHYATSKITPQQTPEEIYVTERVLRRKSPCNFLVFGLGHDSLMWASLNHGGRTVFLEEDKNWIRQILGKFPMLVSHHVNYDTKVRHWNKLLGVAKGNKECERVVDPRESNCTLALKNLPKEIYEVEWDLIMVDAPTGYHEDAPGRMQAIYTAGLIGRNKNEGDLDVFVHDVDRDIEDVFSKEFLCEGYLVEQVGRLRHFTIRSHKTRPGTSFCPANVISK